MSGDAVEHAAGIHQAARDRGGLRPWHVLGATALLFPPVAMFAPAGLVILAALAVIGMLGARGVRSAAPRLVTWHFGALFGVIALWMLASAFWAPNHSDSLSLWASVLVIFAGGLALFAGSHVMAVQDRRNLETALVAAGIFYLVLIVFEVATGGITLDAERGVVHVEPFNRGAAVMALFAWPFAFAAYRRFGAWAGAGALVLSLAALFLLTMETAMLAGVIGVVVLAAVWWAPRPALLAIGILAVAFVLVVPLLPDLVGDPMAYYDPVDPRLPSTLIHRFLIWQFVAERIGDAPFIGWGLDASRALPGGDQTFFSPTAVALPLHPHNGALQVWVELGLAGALLASVLIASVLVMLWRANLGREATAAGAALFSAYFVLGGLSFGVWQNWWLVLPWMLAAFLRAAAGERTAA